MKYPVIIKFTKLSSAQCRKKEIGILNSIAQWKQCQGIEDSVEEDYRLKLISSEKTSKLVLINWKSGTELVHDLHRTNCSTLCVTSPCKQCKISTNLLARKFKDGEKQNFKPAATKVRLTNAYR